LNAITIHRKGGDGNENKKQQLLLLAAEREEFNEGGENYTMRSFMICTFHPFKELRLAGHTARMEMKHAYDILVGKPRGKRPLGRSRRRGMDNTKNILKK
jgi:hypothetical protein